MYSKMKKFGAGAVLAASLAGAMTMSNAGGATGATKGSTTNIVDIRQAEGEQAAVLGARQGVTIVKWVWKGGRWVQERTIRCFPTCTWRSYLGR